MSPPSGTPAQPPDPTRRRLLLTAGFVAANVAVLRQLPSSDEGTSTRETVRVELRADPAITPPVLAGADGPPPAGHRFELVIKGGRVIDPESGFDHVADVGIDGDRIASISPDPLIGEATIDATGRIVAPGFIDVLSYEPDLYGAWFKIGDGVTTNLGMHGLNHTAESFFSYYGTDERRPPVHYGGAFDNNHMRHVVAGLRTEPATRAQLDELKRMLEEGVENGWIGVSVEPEYTPYVTTEEIAGLARVAAGAGLPLFSHIRSSDPQPGPDGSLAALDELLRVAEDTGVGVHVDHITSMNTHVMSDAVEKLDAARDRGIEVTACMYPYDFWATTLATERFSPGWQERYRISYSDLEVPGTGERLTESSFRRYQAENLLVAAHAIPETDVQDALRVPWIMIGSDAILEPPNNNHPRSTGAFTRTLGRYVRELGVLSWPEALAKMTILPARRLETRVPALRRKGRLQIGADADLTVFDPNEVADRSTVSDPAQMAAGIDYVMVSGRLVKEGDDIHDEVRLGQPIRPE
jgi:N-acyl-D-aspartate/D-glutamate deacylase